MIGLHYRQLSSLIYYIYNVFGQAPLFGDIQLIGGIYQTLKSGSKAV